MSVTIADRMNVYLQIWMTVKKEEAENENLAMQCLQIYSQGRHTT